MPLADHEIKKVNGLISLIEPFVDHKESFGGASYGLSTCGYDVRLGPHTVSPSWQTKLYGLRIDEDFATENRFYEHGSALKVCPGDFVLCHTAEIINMPPHLMGIVHDKSTWARMGLAVQNTVLEPGWSGQVTLELSNHGPFNVELPIGCGIAQVVFHRVNDPEKPYNGKYNNQRGVVLPRKSVP